MVLDRSRYTRGNAGTHLANDEKPALGAVKARHGFVSDANRARAENHGRASLTSLFLLTGLDRHARFTHEVPSEVDTYIKAVDLCDTINRSPQVVARVWLVESKRDEDKLGENKASNEHLTKSYTKPQLTLSPHSRPDTHAHTCHPLPQCHGGEWKGTKNVQMCEKKGTLAFGKRAPS